MPRKRLQRIEAWSDSRKRDYDACPRKAFFKHVQKIREPENKAMTRGQRIHTESEDYAIGKTNDLPESCELFEEEFTYLRSIRKLLEVERQLAVTKSWEPCDWFDSETWLRAKLDLGWLDPDELTLYHVVDIKSGKVREANLEQLDLYAPVVFAHAADSVETVIASLFYVDHGVIGGPRYYDRDDVARLQKQWEKRTKRMLSDTQFKPTPGLHCRFCFYGQDGKKRGGPGLCKF